MVLFTEAVAVVTGGGSGIGQTTAVEFAKRGTSVVIADVDIEGGEETVTEIDNAGGDAIFVETDVTNPDNTQAMVDTAVEEYGRLDYVFNNAGISGDQAPIPTIPPRCGKASST